MKTHTKKRWRIAENKSWHTHINKQTERRGEKPIAQTKTPKQKQERGGRETERETERLLVS